MFDAVVERFVAGSPVAVMTRLVLERTVRAEWVDAVFAAHAEQQYTRELLFSTVVELMALVALGLRPSLHAAARAALADGTLGVSVQALYEKARHSEPTVLRALVRESAAQLAPVVAAVHAAPAPPWLPGYQVRVLDGNHLAASEKRLKPLRGTRAGALPGQALVLYAPEHDLVVDLVAGEDAHAQEPTFLAPLLATATAGELWIADRNFATRAILHALTARGAAVLVRENGGHATVAAAGERVAIGRGAAGVVWEQAVVCPPPGAPPSGTPAVALRRIEVELDVPLESGETVLRLLTTLPAAAADAHVVAALYRRRWSIEGMFQRLEAVLCSEVAALGYPRAALLAFSVAVVAYNVLALVQATLEAQAAAAAVASPGTAPVPISLYYVAHEVRAAYHGMLIAIDPAGWAQYDTADATVLAATLRRISAHVRLEAFRKHPRTGTGHRKKGYAPSAEVRRHIATARVLDEQRQNQSRPAP